MDNETNEVLTNEAMAERIQAGEKDLLFDLWAKTRGFVWRMAYKRWTALQTAGRTTIELDDLLQSGYLALVDAAEKYIPNQGYGFLSALKFSLLKEFDRACGWRGSNRNDALHFASSLDVPLGEDEDSGTLQDIIADPVDAYEAVDERDRRERLRYAVSKIMAALEKDQRRVLELRFMLGLTRKRAAEVMGISVYEISALEERARRNFADCRISCETLEQFIDFKTNWFYRVSLERAQWTSPVEMLVVRREEIRKNAGQRCLIEEENV